MYGSDEIKEILELRDKGWSQRKVAEELLYSRNFVRKCWKITKDEMMMMKPIHRHKLDTYSKEIIKLYERSENNCEVIRYDLIKAHPELNVSLRTIERYTECLRRQKKIEEKKYREYRSIETHPGEFMQIDYGTKIVPISKIKTKIHLFVGILAYSRRFFVKLTQGETQDEWLSSIEDAFQYFGGIPATLVCDNASPRGIHAARRGEGSRTCRFTQGLIAFGEYWNVTIRACYPYYPQSKGKVESSVKYVKHNAIAGRSFDSQEALQAHLTEWATTYADWKPKRIVGCSETVPAKRFEIEKSHLRPIEKPPFHECKEEVRKVREDGIIMVENAYYQLPIQFAKITVRLLVRPKTIEVYQGNKLLQEINKDRDKKVPEILDSSDAFGATDPALSTPISLHRSLSSYGTAFGEGASASNENGKEHSSQSVNSTAEAEKAREDTTAESPSFTRDLSEYERVTGGF